MQLVVPDILAEARGLSVGVVGMGLTLGLFLWMFGWWSHRFWVVLITTVLAGVFGLYESHAFHTNQLLASLLLALTAGLLALHLVRVLAFLAGGMAGLLIAQSLVPNLNQSLLCFLISGLLGLMLFRLWMMGLTSLGGTLLFSYCGLSLLERAGSMDAVAWSGEGGVLVNWMCGFLAGLGVIVQYLLDRRSRGKSGSSKKKDDEKRDWNVLTPQTWPRIYRKAG
jgi:hypothetical protein